MTTASYPHIQDVLPQSGRMVLLTRILRHTERQTTCTVEISPTSAFADADGGVPAWVALEYMAQCIAAHGGLRALAAGDPVAIGFLLGSRSVALHTPRFHPGQQLEIEAAHVWGEQDFFSFACTVRDTRTQATLVEGTLTVARAAGADALTGRGQGPAR
jgi:predicted hotdog family 3-hydroxylacyl-ACP dehydratase